jgi:uncharacterized protein YxjI
VNEMGIFGGRKRFIIQSKLENLKDTGSIMDANMKILAYFKHKHTWKPLPESTPYYWQEARKTDIRLEAIDGTLLGEIHEIPPPALTLRLIRKWEIYNAKKELKGVVKEKPKAIGSDWVLESPDGKVIATIKVNRKKKDYEVQTTEKQVIARCYRDASMGKNSYQVDILSSEIDFFLILSYIVVLDRIKWAWVKGGYV